jgi:hypothetical protein
MARPRRRRASLEKTSSTARNGKGRRGRRSDAATRVRDLVARYVQDLVEAIHKHTRKNMAAEVRAFIAANGGSIGRIGKRGRPAGLRRKRIVPCIAPGCTNPSKGPRFHYLCEKHRDAPKKDYEAWRLKARAARAA